ncbi:hypothetical protein BGAL_0115g00140 [Botrytis galanthina]|uniref:Uncharacterized protein n=1 Tax=Botrytis galanthina TaxID=278940 RepID=A0A4S8R0N2_9HELO|nr:hypothetical protein BGAL_0115g00140 [Botrytis galanthina]
MVKKNVNDMTSILEDLYPLGFCYRAIVIGIKFWTLRTDAEGDVIWELLCETEEIIMGEEGAAFYASRKLAFLPNELEAFHAGSREWSHRPTRAKKMQASAMAKAALPDAPKWIRRLYRRGRTCGDFLCHWEGFVKFTLKHNGSKNIIDAKWYMIPFNAPGSAVVPYTSVAGTALDASDKSSQQNRVILRRAFREILQDPLWYEQRADDAPITVFGGQRRFDLYKDGLASSGINTNTFLVFDRICMASVLESGRSIESMRICAFEADYPLPEKIYAEGYQGYTLVRLDQLVYNFYELRSIKADKVGMDEIWQAAQQSRNAAFVSLDTKEAGNWTPSNPMGRFFSW